MFSQANLITRPSHSDVLNVILLFLHTINTFPSCCSVCHQIPNFIRMLILIVMEYFGERRYSAGGPRVGPKAQKRWVRLRRAGPEGFSKSSLWGFSRGILVVFGGPSNVHVWALGLSCEAPAVPKERKQDKNKQMHLGTKKTPSGQKKRRKSGQKTTSVCVCVCLCVFVCVVVSHTQHTHNTHTHTDVAFCPEFRILICPECCLFCPDNHLLILSRFRSRRLRGRRGFTRQPAFGTK